MKLQTERLKLRELALTDVNDIHELHSLPETDQYNTLGIPGHIEVTKKLVAEWINAREELPRKRYVFTIENNAEIFIGLIGINLGKPGYSSAEIWYKLHLQYWNQGYATEAVKRILHFIFAELKLHRVEAGCAIKNLASVKVLEKVGFTREGLKRKILPIRGEWIDNYMYAILKEDFNK